MRRAPNVDGSVRLYWGVMEEKDGLAPWLVPTSCRACEAMCAGLAAASLAGTSPGASNGDVDEEVVVLDAGGAATRCFPTADGPMAAARLLISAAGETPSDDTPMVETPTDDTVPPTAATLLNWEMTELSRVMVVCTVMGASLGISAVGGAGPAETGVAELDIFSAKKSPYGSPRFFQLSFL